MIQKLSFACTLIYAARLAASSFCGDIIDLTVHQNTFADVVDNPVNVVVFTHAVVSGKSLVARAVYSVGCYAIMLTDLIKCGIDISYALVKMYPGSEMA